MSNGIVFRHAYKGVHGINFLESSGKWKLLFNQGAVTLIKIDFRLTSVFTDGSETVELCIETPFTMQNKVAKFICVPEDTKSLAPVLPLMKSRVHSIEIKSSGHLTVCLDSEVTIKVDPNPSYEPWQLARSSGFLMICPPEGQVITFEEPGHLRT